MPSTNTAWLILSGAAHRRKLEREEREFAMARRLGIGWRKALREEIEHARRGGYLIEMSPDLVEAILDRLEVEAGA